jgi:hypothetical protein
MNLKSIVKFSKFMKFCIVLTLLASCGGDSGNTERSNSKKETVEPPPVNDTLAVAQTIHDFYKWYETADEQLGRFEIVDKSGKFAKLNQKELNEYLAEFKKTGLVSEEFLQGHENRYKTYESAWKSENKDEILTGMDADELVCGQDWDEQLFMTSPVRIDSRNDKRVQATMLFPASAGQGEQRHYELVLEGKRWRIAKIICDMLGN